MYSGISKKTKVTVLIPVYNGEKYLKEAIESILHQTFTDFEFLIINDGSTDRSVEIIQSYTDSRIRMIHNDKNLKLIATLNKGLDIAQGEYVARMDCDDISLPERLARQVAFMDSNRDVGICGTWAKTIGDDPGHIFSYEINSKKIKAQLLFDCCLAHPSIIMRRALLVKYNLKYYESDLHAEDWGLWQRASVCFDLSNIPEILLLYRIKQTSVSRANAELQENTLNYVNKLSLSKLNINATQEEQRLHRMIGGWKFESSIDFLTKSEKWLIKLIEKNNKVGRYPLKEFAEVTTQRYYAICSCAASLGVASYKAFFNSKLSDYAKINKDSRVKFFIKCLIKYDK